MTQGCRPRPAARGAVALELVAARGVPLSSADLVRAVTGRVVIAARPDETARVISAREVVRALYSLRRDGAVHVVRAPGTSSAHARHWTLSASSVRGR